MALPIGGHGLQIVHGHVGARTDRTRCAGTVRRLGPGRVSPSRQPAFLVFEPILAQSRGFSSLCPQLDFDVGELSLGIGCGACYRDTVTADGGAVDRDAWWGIRRRRSDGDRISGYIRGGAIIVFRGYTRHIDRIRM